MRGGLLFLVTLLLAGCSVFEDARYDFEGLPPGSTRVVIDLREQKAYLYAGGERVLSSPVSTGREGHDTAPGRYKIIEKDAYHRSSVYGAYLADDGQVIEPDVDNRKDPRPPGARFVGASMPHFMRIYGGVGMHAGYLPGYPASHGCIRMPAGKARRFYDAVSVGTPITVLR
ncbi:MAG: L,D-transpeptidase family protein [Verrucomicrobia bacterium]|nr:L,D-transpeptidase family protein [Verrucomicrobiota bacterium]